MASAAAVDIALGLSGMDTTLGGLGLVDRALGTVGNGGRSALGAAAGAATAFGGALLTVGAAGAVALGGLGTLVGTTGVNFLAMKEQAQVAFTTMLGSGEKATAFLGKLQTFAAQTPFEFEDVTRASQRLMAMGISADKVIPTLTAIGDAVAGLGGGPATVDQVTTAIGQMNAKGKASGDEMMQLTEAGIPAWKYLAAAIGTDIPEAMKRVSAGTVPAGVAINAITAGMEKDFGGMMAAQSRTFNGLKSSLSDYGKQLAAAMVQPLFTRVLLPAMTRLTDYMAGPGMAAAARFGAGLDQALTRAITVGRAFAASTQREITGRVLPAFNLLLSAFARVNTSMTQGSNVTMLQRAEGVVYRLARGFQLAVDAVVTFKQALNGDWTNNGQINGFVVAFGRAGNILGSVIALVRTFAAYLSTAHQTGDWLNDFAADLPDNLRGAALAAGRIVVAFDTLRAGVAQVVTALTAQDVTAGPFAEDGPIMRGALALGGILSSLPDIIGENLTRFSSLRDIVSENATRFDGLTAAIGRFNGAHPNVGKVAGMAGAGAAGAGALAVANPGIALAAGRAGLGALGSVAGMVGPVLGGLVGILGGPLTLALGAVALAVGALYLAWTTDFLGIQELVLPVVASLAAWFTGTLVPAITTLATTIGTFLMPYITLLGAALQQAIVNATPGVTLFFQQVQVFAAAAWPIIQQVAAVIIDSLGPAVNALFMWATTIIPLVGTVIGDVFAGIGLVLGVLAGLFQTHHDAIVNVVLIAWATIAGLVQTWWALVSGIITLGLQLLTGDWAGAWLTLQTTAATVWAGILTALQAFWDGFTAIVGLALQGLVALFTLSLQGWIDIGTAIVEGIKSGITGAWESLKTLLGTLAGELPGPLKTVLGIHSPSTVFADQVGAQIPAGIAQGITANAGTVTSALNGLPTSMDRLGASAASVGSALAPSTGGGGGRGPITLNITVNGITPGQVAQEIYDNLAPLLGESGGAGLPPMATAGGGPF